MAPTMPGPIPTPSAPGGDPAPGDRTSATLVAEHRADSELAAAIVRGEREPTEAFFNDHVDDLYAFVHYRAGADRQAVEDLVQETFLSALDSIERYDGRASLGTWLRGIARNKVRSWRRRRKPTALADVLDQSEAEIDAILSRVQREPLPDWALEHRETRELVGAALSSLPQDYGRALEAKYVDGMSVAQVGSMLGRTTKATESLLTRARTAFGEVLELIARRRGGRP